MSGSDYGYAKQQGGHIFVDKKKRNIDSGSVEASVEIIPIFIHAGIIRPKCNIDLFLDITAVHWVKREVQRQQDEVDIFQVPAAYEQHEERAKNILLLRIQGQLMDVLVQIGAG